MHTKLLPTVHSMDSRVDEMTGCGGIALDPWRIWDCRKILGNAYRTTAYNDQLPTGCEGCIIKLSDSQKTTMVAINPERK